MTSKIQFNPFSPEFKANPYPIYARLRQEDPVHWSFLKTWFITRYDDVNMILKDSRFTVDNLPLRIEQKKAYLTEGDFNPLVKSLKPWLFFNEPPLHTRLRSHLSKIFAPKNVESRQSEIQQTTDELLAKVENNRIIDIINDLSGTLATTTIAKILGLPMKDLSKLSYLSQNLFPVFENPIPLEILKNTNITAMQAITYFEEIIASKEKQLSSDLISHLIIARDEGNKLTQDEILGFCIQLLIVGQETTKAFIGNAVLALLENREKWQELRENPHIIVNAVEELLRYDPPVQLVARFPLEDVEIRGQKISMGQPVTLCLAAANRDREKYPEPDKLNFNRQESNLAFGGGIHLCLGHFLAKLQGQIAINSLIQKFPNLQLESEDLQRRDSFVFRGLNSLKTINN